MLPMLQMMVVREVIVGAVQFSRRARGNRCSYTLCTASSTFLKVVALHSSEFSTDMTVFIIETHFRTN